MNKRGYRTISSRKKQDVKLKKIKHNKKALMDMHEHYFFGSDDGSQASEKEEKALFLSEFRIHQKVNE